VEIVAWAFVFVRGKPLSVGLREFTMLNTRAILTIQNGVTRKFGVECTTAEGNHLPISPFPPFHSH
jgi:hypothetical protein